ncbi:sugar O-acetyltransferase [Clostridium bornimense]|uniref:sugar O-acetyltransferase n=1 Tax=Clostridium bornimense TaxID=1216932 RepID=UPI001C0FC023|nr:sugar O-acetyltransferase [Clostridium bornimense]MBU5316284.1 sugar O-acetyltransferase [Clostridium bornimense]
MKSEKELMLSGQLYKALDDELFKDSRKARRLTRLFNNSNEDDLEYRTDLLKQLFKTVGENIYIEPSFHCDYGSNISVGNNFYANYDCIILDVCDVSIGNNVFLAPRVSIFTAGHPIDAEVRDELLEFGKPVTIGNSVWIGGNTVINPGVSIGNNVVIGSGSVVTKDIPDNVIAVGNPCRVLREINEEDKVYWNKKREEYYQNRK